MNSYEDSEPSTEPAGEPASEPSEPASEPSEPADEDTGTDCGDGGSIEECYECLSNENPAGAQAYNAAIIDNCFCASECEASCTDFCADETQETPPTSECDTCFAGIAGDSSSQCVLGFTADCGADETCNDFVNSLQTCQ